MHYVFFSFFSEHDIEMLDGRVSLEPLFHAERQRMFLKHAIANRQEENELMEDVPGWQVRLKKKRKDTNIVCKNMQLVKEI